MPRPTTATIHADALRHNLGQVRARAPGSRVMAVVKADGYGHGLERVARALDGADAYEMITDAVHTESGTPLRVYQVVIAEGSHYLLVQGYVGADRAAELIPAFQAVARSLRRTR